jgi:hypothetical protein
MVRIQWLADTRGFSYFFFLRQVVSLTSGGGYQRRRAEEPVFGGDGDQRAAALSFLSSRKRSLFRNISPFSFFANRNISPLKQRNYKNTSIRKTNK